MKANAKNREAAPPAIEIHTDPGLPTVFADTVNVSRRPDGTYLLRFACSMPEGHRFEHARVVLTAQHFGTLVDVMAKVGEHWPQKPVPEKPAKDTNAG